MREIARGMRLTGLVLLLGAAGAISLRGQDPRDATVARAFREFDTSRRLQMLISILNPTFGPPRGAWSVGVQLLAQTLLEEGRDSAAAVWLRWAIRLSPEMQPDTVVFLPEVVTAYRSAREYVASTSGPADSFAVTNWLWAAQAGGDPAGRLQIVVSGQTAVRVAVRGIGRVVPGGSIPFKPGSYQISAAGAGYDSLRVVTREVLPGVTTVMEFRPRPAAVQVAVKPPSPVRSPRKKKGFPVVWAGLGAAGAVALVAVLTSNNNGASEPTGGVIITIPSP